MVSTRGTALLVTADQAVAQWMIECVTSMGLGYTSVQEVEQIDEVEGSLSLCLLDAAGIGSQSWNGWLSQARKRYPLLPAVLVSSEPNPKVPKEALGAGIVDVVSIEDDLAGIESRLHRIMRRVNAVDDIRSAIHALGALNGAGRGQGETSTSGRGQTDRSVLLVGAESSLGEAETTLQEAEMQVTRAESFALARSAAEQQRFQVVVVDNDLPDASGLTAMRDLAAVLPEARILFVVGFTGADDAVQALRWGAASFLIKPLGPKQLLEQVQTLMETTVHQTGGTPGLHGNAGQAVALLEDAIARLCSLN